MSETRTLYKAIEVERDLTQEEIDARHKEILERAAAMSANCHGALVILLRNGSAQSCAQAELMGGASPPAMAHATSCLVEGLADTIQDMLRDSRHHHTNCQCGQIVSWLRHVANTIAHLYAAGEDNDAEATGATVQDASSTTH